MAKYGIEQRKLIERIFFNFYIRITTKIFNWVDIKYVKNACSVWLIK